MVTLDKISRIGFGAYRVNEKNKDHFLSLKYALENGCNLVDTASNYENGGSEKLIGEVLRSDRNLDAFVVTKAGYILQDELPEIRQNISDDFCKNELHKIDDYTYYSIHPDILKYKINKSIKRLGRNRIDCFLLHNPEYLFQFIDKDEFISSLKCAFQFLEEEAVKNRIRYYGISSNALLKADDQLKSITLKELLAVVNEVSSKGYFKFIQFPFNLAENFPLQTGENGDNVFEIAKNNSLKILTNRPLNARLNGSMLRISGAFSEFKTEINSFNICFENCVKLLRARFREIELSAEPLDLEIMKFINENAAKLDSSESVDELFYGYLFPWLNKIYENNIPADAGENFSSLYKLSLSSSKVNMAEKSKLFRERLENEGILERNINFSFPYLACQKYLNTGADHVLVGMRKKEYVDELKVLF